MFKSSECQISNFYSIIQEYLYSCVFRYNLTFPDNKSIRETQEDYKVIAWESCSGVLFLLTVAPSFPSASLFYSSQIQFSICRTEAVSAILAHFLWEGTMRISETISQ